jgi:hypothetical protein
MSIWTAAHAADRHRDTSSRAERPKTGNETNIAISKEEPGGVAAGTRRFRVALRPRLYMRMRMTPPMSNTAPATRIALMG